MRHFERAKHFGSSVATKGRPFAGLGFWLGQLLLSLLTSVLLAQASTSASAVKLNAPVNPANSLTLQAETAPPKERTYNGDVTFTLMGRRFDDPIVNSRFSRLIIALDMEALYQDWFSAKLGISQLLTSGQSSTLYAVTEGGTGSGTYVDQANLNLMPMKGLKGSVGILQNAINPVYSQMYPQSNAGGALEAKLGDEKTSLTFSANQTTPTSKSGSNRVVDEDTLPLLTVGSLVGELKSESWGSKFKVGASRFIFTDLSSQSAADSQQTGSDTVGNGKGGFLFAYEYRGTEFAALAEQEIFAADKMTLKGSTLVNELAPVNNKAWQAKFEYNRVFNKWTLVPSVVRFHAEANALPSVYSIPGSGFTNRDGYGWGLKADFPNQKFNVFGGYTKSNVIDLQTTAAAFQADRDIYTLGAEAKYDLF